MTVGAWGILWYSWRETRHLLLPEKECPVQYTNLGRTGLKVSRICLGCMTYGAPATGTNQPGRHAWTLDEQASQPFLRQALDLGPMGLAQMQRELARI